MTDSDRMPHRPRMSADRAERIRRWHHDALNRNHGRTEITVDYLGLRLTIPPTVLPITPVSHLMGEAVLAEVTPTDRVLDMGTGSGVNAILAARTATEVLAVDINPDAVEAARDNAETNRVGDRVAVRLGDCFDGVTGRFDLIVFDPPFRWFTPRDHAEAATTDADYRTLRRFFRQAEHHLTDRGRLLVFFGSTGDIDFLKELAETAGYHRETVAEFTETVDDWPVGYHTFRFSRVD